MDAGPCRRVVRNRNGGRIQFFSGKLKKRLVKGLTDRSDPISQLVHSNPTLQALPNGDMLCVWFANKAAHISGK
eukprot:2466518-Pyramimonas_sp.AAC.1